MVNIRVNDPQQALAAQTASPVTAPAAGTAVSPHLALFARTPLGLLEPLVITAQDAAGLNLETTIPFTPVATSPSSATRFRSRIQLDISLSAPGSFHYGSADAHRPSQRGHASGIEAMAKPAGRYPVRRYVAPLAMASIAPGALHAQATGLSLSPPFGTGTSQLFTFHAYGYVSQMLFLFDNGGVNGVNACFIQFDPAARQVYLTDDGATTWRTGGALGSSTPLSNSQCIINLAQSNTNGTSGERPVSQPGHHILLRTPTSRLELKVRLRIQQSTTQARSRTGNGWVWTIESASPLAPDSVTPPSGGGATQTFTCTRLQPPNGSSYINQYQMLFNWTVDGTWGMLDDVPPERLLAVLDE